MQFMNHQIPGQQKLGFPRLLLCPFVALIATIAPAIASGQAERLELGRRLQRFELAWQQADSQQRTDSVPPLKAAVNSFFSLQLAEAGRQLDQAWRIAVGKQHWTALENSAIGLQLLVSPFCADASHAELELRLTPFYKTGVPLPDGSRMVVKLLDSKWKLVSEKDYLLSNPVAPCKWSTGQLSPGDYRLQAEIRNGDELFSLPDTIIGRIENLDARLKSLEESLVDAVGRLDDTVRATVRDSTALLRGMQRGEVQETSYPASARLMSCESLLQPDAQTGEVFASLAQRSDVWLSLAVGRKSVPVRLRAPENHAGPLPVLFLFHGAGGSENMFFETYGAGRVVDQALKRGWLVVAPRQNLFNLPLDIAAMTDVLDKSFKIDRSRIMLLGHSMGAGQVIRQASLHPDLPVAVVALGGGNRLNNAAKLTPIRWFVAAGDQDFGRGGARQLHNSLDSAGVASVYRDYPNVEHLVIVQAAIDDVFRFLDETLAKKNVSRSKGRIAVSESSIAKGRQRLVTCLNWQIRVLFRKLFCFSSGIAPFLRTKLQFSGHSLFPMLASRSWPKILTSLPYQHHFLNRKCFPPRIAITNTNHCMS